MISISSLSPFIQTYSWEKHSNVISQTKDTEIQFDVLPLENCTGRKYDCPDVLVSSVMRLSNSDLGHGHEQ